MKTIEKHRLDNNWNHAKQLWSDMKIIYKLNDWHLKLMDSIDNGGLCSYNDKIIYLSTFLLRGHNCNYKKVRKVLLHEIAHALTPGHSHGLKWKEKCKEIGGDSRLAVSMALPGANWSISCSKCKYHFTFKDKPDKMICGKCNSLIKIKFIV